MRVWVMLALVLVSSSSPAQKLSSEMRQTLPADQISQPKDSPDFAIAAPTPGRWALPDSNRSRCFFIRSYNFERRGTGAPILKDVTTCTPAKSDQFRQTDRKPQVRLIPAS